MKVQDLHPNLSNPRKIDDWHLDALGKSLKKFGDLGCVVFNRRSQRLIGGHQRVRSISPDCVVTIITNYLKPTKTGTVAEGFIEVDGERFNYREVDWDETTEKAGNIAANKSGGEWDFPKLNDWLLELDQDNYDMDLLGFSPKELEDTLVPENYKGNEDTDLYTKKITIPIYEPKGEKPLEKDLYDQEKTKSLLEEIEKSNIDPTIKEFLTLAANRHTVFNYQNIAEYYSHASPEVQSLMENSALVIIDFKKAIEKGFVTMTQEIAAEYKTTEEQ